MNQHQMIQNIYNHSTLMSQHKVEEYIKSLQLETGMYPNIHRVNLTGGSEKVVGCFLLLNKYLTSSDPK